MALITSEKDDVGLPIASFRRGDNEKGTIMTGDEKITGHLPPSDGRYYEDYIVGEVYECGRFTIAENEIIEFATHYDPQPMHIDASVTGGVVASGWHTACLTMRLIADNFLSRVAGLPSPGVEAITWSHPIHPGEQVHVIAKVEASRISRSKPDRGILTTTFIARNSEGIAVMTFRASNFVRLREK